MEIALAVIFGLLAGSGARWLMPGPDPLGLYGAMALGAVGAVIGYAVALQFGPGTAAGEDPVGTLGVAITSCLGVLFLYRAHAMSTATERH